MYQSYSNQNDAPTEEYEDEEYEVKKQGQLSCWGNQQNMNLNPLILTNITGSPYFKVQLLIDIPDSSVTLASWIPASMTTLALAMAPFASALCQRYNCRNVTFIGSLLCFIGISLSSLASNVETLFVTFGLLTGLGIGMSTTPGIILVARYFDKRRGIANAFCLSGTSTFVFLNGS